MKFTKDQNKVWETLFANQINNVEKFACQEYLEGFCRLNLPRNKVPSETFLNKKITPNTGWKVFRTNIRYSDTLPWYQYFTQHRFLLSNYLRTWDELNYTPEPDMFHDIFGHLPYLTLRRYSELYDIFTDAYFRGSDGQKEEVKRLAWFSYEFGLIKERGEIKLFGTGLISSKGETEHVMNGKIPILPFTIENVLQRNKAIDYFNNELFVFESLDGLKGLLKDHFKTFEKKTWNPKDIGTIKDNEMDLSQYK